MKVYKIDHSSMLLATRFTVTDKSKQLGDVIAIFNGGSSYVYHNVPLNVYKNMRRAKSKGKAFNRLIKRYTFDKLEKEPA